VWVAQAKRLLVGWLLVWAASAGATTGTAARGACLPTQAAAAQMWCTSYAMWTSTVYYTCDAVITSLSTTEGGAVGTAFQFTRRSTTISSGASSTTTATGVALGACELENYSVFPFTLSVADGVALSMALLALWVAAFGVRALIRTLQGYEGEKE
jgi:hypothetical protein